MKQQSGLSLIELLIAVTLAAILIAGMQGLVGLALNAESSTRARNDSLQQGRFAMQLMVKSVRMTQRLMIPLADNPKTSGINESEHNVLAVTLDPTLDRDKDGWVDANNDKDYFDLNENGSHDEGEDLIDEDLSADATNDGEGGIIGIDDDNDGLVDESSLNDDDEDGVLLEDKYNGLDDDGDGSIDEDSDGDMDQDGFSGNGTGGAGHNKDDDEDGGIDEDWLDPVVYFLDVDKNLIQRVPNINPSDGTDFQENPIAENITAFQVIRIPQGDGRSVLVDITLEVTSANGELVSFNTSVGVGSGL